MITEQDIQQATMFIDGVDIYTVGALVKDFKVSATAIANTAYQGMDSTNFNVLSTVRGMRVITVTLFYRGSTKRELALKKAKIDNALGAGKVELYLPDGFYYSAYLTSAGEESVLGVEGQDVIAVCTYTLEGIRHDALETIDTRSGADFLCKSLIPETDVKITYKNTSGYASIVISGVSITGLSNNDQVVIDGINKRILKNGVPFSGGVTFIKFPKLAPGVNRITTKVGAYTVNVDLTVEYYPTY